jgi:hypothetical protein
MKHLFEFDAGYLANEPAPKPAKAVRPMPVAWVDFERGNQMPANYKVFWDEGKDGGDTFTQTGANSYEATPVEQPLKLEVGARVKHISTGQIGEAVSSHSPHRLWRIALDSGRNFVVKEESIKVIPRDLPLGWHRVKVGEPWPEFGREVRVSMRPEYWIDATSENVNMQVIPTHLVRYWAELPENGGPK